jgi:hypothetical protein
MSLRDGGHYDDSMDMIERIRKLKEAAERKMNAFGNPSEYDVRIKKKEPQENSAEEPGQ